MGRSGSNFRAPRDGEHVIVSCWCESDFVWLPVEEVRAGKTGSCRARDCRPPKETT
jgi:hypothetical protein